MRWPIGWSSFMLSHSKVTCLFWCTLIEIHNFACFHVHCFLPDKTFFQLNWVFYTYLQNVCASWCFHPAFFSKSSPLASWDEKKQKRVQKIHTLGSSPKIDISVINCSKPVRISFIFGTQINIFYYIFASLYSHECTVNMEENKLNKVITLVFFHKIKVEPLMTQGLFYWCPYYLSGPWLCQLHCSL